MHVELVGSGPRLVLVHGSVSAGWTAWEAQRPLAERFTLVVPSRSGEAFLEAFRGGYPKEPIPRVLPTARLLGFLARADADEADPAPPAG